MNKKIKFAIIGLGRAGRFHLTSLTQMSSSNLKYVVDPKISPTHEIIINNSFILLDSIDTVISDPEIDAVIISTPTQFHFQYICQFLKAGKHVFTEKPLGNSSEQISICFDLAKENNLALYLGFQRRYDKNFIELKNNIEKIGNVRTIKISSRDNPKPTIDYLKISGNIFHDMLIHDFDMLQFLLGYQVPISIFAFGHAYDPEIKELNDFDTVLVTLKYENGLICSIDTSRVSVYGYDQRIELFAENGMAIAENERNNTVEVHTNNGTLRNPINASFPQRYKEAYVNEMSDFVNGIQQGVLFNVSKSECLLGHRIADAAYESSISNTVINFKEEFDKD